MASGVFSAVEKKTLQDRVVAVKSYKTHHGRLVRRHRERELWALRGLRAGSAHDAWSHHIIYLLDVEETPAACNLVLPFYDKTLQQFADRCDRALAFQAVYQLAQGLSFLHSHGVIHCDLSISNVLVDTAHCNHMIITDFGCAHPAAEQQHATTTDDANDDAYDHEEIGTLYYKAPEHLFGCRVYASSTDIWSLGTIFCHLLRGKPLFDGESDIEQIGQIVRTLGPPSTTVLNEEMRQYPDTDKLIFFGGDSVNKDDDDDSGDNQGDVDEDVMAMISAQREAFDKLLGVPHAKRLIQGMLTWSVRKRFTASEIVKLAHSKEDMTCFCIQE